MSTGMIEHWGMVQRVAGGRATVVVETTSCGVCGHGGHCGIGKHAGGRQATQLELEAVDGIKEGDFVSIGLPESRLTLAALLGYLFPVLAALAGALLGLSTGGGIAMVALGAAIGILASLVVARIAIALTSGLTPTPKIVSQSSFFSQFSQE